MREQEEGYAALARLREAEDAIASRDDRRAKWKQQAEDAIAQRSRALDIADTLAAAAVRAYLDGNRVDFALALNTYANARTSL